MKGVCGGKGVTTKALFTVRKRRGQWNPDWTEPTRVVRQSRRWKPAQLVQVSREKCLLDSFEMICEAMKVTATAYGSGHGRLNCLSPRFPVFCWSMKIKTTRLLWRECGTNQCQKKLALECTLPWLRCMDGMCFFYHLLIFSVSCSLFFFPCTWVFHCFQ